MPSLTVSYQSDLGQLRVLSVLLQDSVVRHRDFLESKWVKVTRSVTAPLFIDAILCLLFGCCFFVIHAKSQ